LQLLRALIAYLGRTQLLCLPRGSNTEVSVHDCESA
jgi:hypothetical protein